MSGHGGRRVGAGGRRRLAPQITEVQLTHRQHNALVGMRSATGIPKAELIRRAVETYLVASGYLEPFQPKPNRTNEGDAA